MATRATAEVIKRNKVLKIQRHRDGLEYYVLPGGSVEDGENPEEGVLRELMEETSIEAEIEKKLFGFVDQEGREHQHFLFKYISGVPKLAEDSVEVGKTTANNTYDPIWMETDKLDSLTIWPEKTKELLVSYIKNETAK